MNAGSDSGAASPPPTPRPEDPSVAARHQDDNRAGAGVSRHAFLAAGAAALGAAALGACSPAGSSTTGTRPATRSATAPRPPAVRHVRRTRIAVVGGGAAGLSAAWWLRRGGLTGGVADFAVLELAAEPGGNARAGANAVRAYPWGAHYVPVPGPRAEHLRTLFAEMGVLRPDGTWNERDLVYAPAERVFVHGRWR